MQKIDNMLQLSDNSENLRENMAINKLSIDIKNCYGINELKQDFELANKNPDFRNERIIQIYAPNGTMKTSLTKCFKDYKEGKISKDIHANEDGIKIIKIDDKEVEKEQIYIVQSYIDDYNSPNISKLLLNAELKKSYEDIHKPIEEKENILKEKIDSLIDNSFKGESLFDKIADFCFANPKKLKIYNYYGLSKIKDYIEDFEYYRKTEDEHIEYSKLDYHILFSDKVIQALKKKNVKDLLSKYFGEYRKLVNNSKIFRFTNIGVFDHQNANNIRSTLVNDNFFEAKHELNLSTKEGNYIPISDNKELKSLIDKERQVIESDDNLKKSWEAVESALDKNYATEFKNYIKNNLWLIDDLNDLEKLRTKLIASYFIVEKQAYSDYIKAWEEQKPKIEDIRNKAKVESDRWKRALEDFHNRFYVPYTIKIENNAPTVLGEDVPNLSFKHNEKDLPKDKMISILSEGEKRTLYLLNIIFDLLTLQDENTNQDKILVIDDIVDSFDYKNKHAILEYIYDITKDCNIYLIMLTHSFDFYRSIANMFQLRYGFIAERNDNQISLEKYESNAKRNDLNPCKYWLKMQTSKDFISSMALIRNLADYSNDDSNNKQLKTKLSNVLHYPLNNQHEDVQSLYVDIKTSPYLNLDSSHTIDGLDCNITFYDHVIREADIISSHDENKYLNLQDKVIIAIALRLLMENKIISYFDNKKITLEEEDFKYNKTRGLINKLKNDCKNMDQNIKRLLDMVNIISSNHIHINSFMYEPLLDINGVDLINKYEELKLTTL